jgi:MFS family permease
LIRVTPLILAVALFMEQMDSTVIATSLPAIAADIGSDPIALKLALTAYFVALAIFIPISGWMADRFGAKNIFRLAIFVFMLGSLACSFSYSLETFVASRFFQGIGSSMMTPVGRLLLVRTTPRSELVAAMAWLTIPALIAPVTGPLIGGFLTTYLSWHWIFWINIPIGIAGIVFSGIYLKVPDERTPRPVDIVGFFIAAVAFAGTVFGLSVISLPALPIIYGYMTLAIGVTAALFYLLHARKTEYPLLDPKLFRHPLFRASITGGSLFRVGVGAMPFLLPLMLQRHRQQVHRRTDFCPFRVPPCARPGGSVRGRAHRGPGDVHGRRPGNRDDGGVAGGRRAALDLLHRHQRHRLCRHFRRGGQPGYRHRGGGTAIVGCFRRGGRRRHSRIDQCAERRTPDPAQFPDCLFHRRRDQRASGHRLFPPAA